MKRLSLILTICVFGCGAEAAGAANQSFSDLICPAAAGPVTQYNKLVNNSDTTVDDAVAAAELVIRDYDTCGSQKLADGNTEEHHYAQLRAAQFHFSAGRLQRLARELGPSLKSLQTAKSLAQEVIDWRASSQSYQSSNGVGGTSVSRNSSSDTKSTYYDSAKQVHDAAVKEIDLVNQDAKDAVASPASASAAPSTRPK